MSASTPFIEYEGRFVAVVGRTRFYMTVDDLGPAAFRFVAVMCLCKREVDEGRISGPFTSELAAQWARLVLVGPGTFSTGETDAELAERLFVPVDQVALARAELQHIGRAFG
jgi:hypothetical protein